MPMGSVTLTQQRNTQQILPILNLVENQEHEMSPTNCVGSGTADGSSPNRTTSENDITEILQCYYQDHDDETQDQQQLGPNGTQEQLPQRSASRPHPCPICHSSYKTRTHLRRHMIGHLTQRPYTCGDCGRGFNRKEHLLKHAASVHTGTKYTCTECGKEISRKDHLARHMKNMHSNNDKRHTHKSHTPISLKKTQRYQKLKSLSPLGIELITTNNTPNQNQLNVTVTPQSLPQLNVNIPTSSSQSQAEHVQNPPPPSYDTDDLDPFRLPHILPPFSLGFTNPPITNPKPSHPCQECNRTYTRREKLTEHVRSVHQGLKFPCKICGKELSRKDHVKRHERSMHPESIVSSRNSSEGNGHSITRRHSAESMEFGDNGSSVLLRSVCPLCLKVFGTPYHLNRHNESCHSGGERAWGCGICGKRFKRKDHLGSHMSKAHWKDGSKQVECEIELQEEVLDGDVNGIIPVRRGENINICGHCQMEFRSETELLEHLNSSSCTTPVTTSSNNVQILNLGAGSSNSRLWISS